MTFRSGAVRGWLQAETERPEKTKINEGTSESHRPNKTEEEEEGRKGGCSGPEVLTVPIGLTDGLPETAEYNPSLGNAIPRMEQQFSTCDQGPPRVPEALPGKP